MANKFSIFSISEANAQFEAAHAAINPLLAAAKVTTIDVNGVPTPAGSDSVSISAKVNALGAVTAAGSSDKQVSELLVSNQVLADQAKEFNSRLISAETNVSTLSNDKAALQAELSTARANVARLTAETAQQASLLKSSNDHASELTTQLNAVNRELSKRCLAVHALVDLRNEKNELLASNASADEKERAADRISPADKINALCGAVNSAVARIGVETAIPGAAGTQTGTSADQPKKPELKGRDRFRASCKIAGR